MIQHTIVWRRFDEPGHEYCSLDDENGKIGLVGFAVFASRGTPYLISYSVHCFRDGTTRKARIAVSTHRSGIAIEIGADRRRRWSLNGRGCREVEGCEDVDLNFSPSTNTLSIRRLNLAVGEEARVRSAWLRFPDFTLHPLEQVYRRVSRDRYAYRTSKGFRATLVVNRAGLITRYGSLWKAETESAGKYPRAGSNGQPAV